ncbi:MAG: ribonuclease P protein component [Sneathiellaceae bacterium]
MSSARSESTPTDRTGPVPAPSFDHAAAAAGDASRPDGGALRRLKQRRDFLRVAGKGRKAARDGLVLQGAPTPASEAGSLRVGLTVSRKVGNAVARNRARRRLRAVAELVLRTQAMPGHDYVLIGRKATLDRGFAALCNDCRQALRRLRLAQEPAPGPATAGGHAAS